jgi:glyoxylase-like metal-dependent hydrolase (beta-lactamase superfamily II)
VLVERIVAPYFATNCWILSTGAGNECVIVDPGIAVPDLAQRIIGRCDELRLKPVAILITHGHLDHTFSLLPLAREGGVSTSYVHPADRELLINPARGLGAQGLALLEQLSPTKVWEEPDRVEEVNDEDVIEVAGMDIQVVHAPGHTKGSVMYRVNSGTLLSGDVLFKGAIGRTDLPTSSPRAMRESLTEKVLTLPDEIRVLPGHGDETTIGQERLTNPFLLEISSSSR